MAEDLPADGPRMVGGRAARGRGGVSWRGEVSPSPVPDVMGPRHGDLGDGRFVAACDEMQNVAVVDVESGAVVHRFRHSGTARRVTFGQDDRTVIAGGEDGVLLAFDCATQSTRELRATTTGGIRTLATLPNGEVASGGKDGFVRIFDCERYESHHRQALRDRRPRDGLRERRAAREHRKRRQAARLRRADRQCPRCLRARAGPRRPRMVFAADNRTIAILEPSEKITLYEVDRGPVRSFIGHDITSEGIDSSPDGKTIAAAGLDCAVRVWDVETGTLRTFHGHLSDVVLVRFSPDGLQLASTGVDGDIRIWDTKSGRDVRRLRGSVQSVDRLAWSSSMRSLVSADQGGFLRVWRLDDDLQRILGGHSADIVPLVFSPSGTRIATGSNDKTLRLWDVTTGTSAPWHGHTSSVRYPGLVGDKVASAGLDQSVRLWSPDGTSRLLFTSERPITELVASGTHVIAATQGGELAFIEIATGAVKVIKAHAGAIQTIPRDWSMVASSPRAATITSYASGTRAPASSEECSTATTQSWGRWPSHLRDTPRSRFQGWHDPRLGPGVAQGNRRAARTRQAHREPRVLTRRRFPGLGQQRSERARLGSAD